MQSSGEHWGSTGQGLVRLFSSSEPRQFAGYDASTPYRTFRFPAKLIQQAVWLHRCFSLSLRDVELILATRSVAVSYESIREWGLRFGRLLANILKRRRPKPRDMWRLDGMLILSAIQAAGWHRPGGDP